MKQQLSRKHDPPFWVSHVLLLQRIILFKNTHPVCSRTRRVPRRVSVSRGIALLYILTWSLLTFNQERSMASPPYKCAEEACHGYAEGHCIIPRSSRMRIKKVVIEMVNLECGVRLSSASSRRIMFVRKSTESTFICVTSSGSSVRWLTATRYFTWPPPLRRWISYENCASSFTSACST